MAGDWIKFEVGTHDKPEVWQMADILHMDPDAVVGKLLRVWTWFDQQTESGVAPASVKMMLDRSVGHEGFCDAIVQCGWMHEEGENVALDDFEKHNGKTAKRRINTAKRVAAHKARLAEANDTGNAEGNSEVTSKVRPSIPRPVRSEVYKRDMNTCRYCGRKEGEYAPPETARDAVISIDHVIPLSSGGANTAENMVTACMSCNSYKSDRTPEEAGFEWPTDQDGKRYGCVTSGVTSALPKEEKRREEKNKEEKNLFDVFWDEYPKKVGKEPSRKAWAKVKVDEELMIQIMHSLGRHKLSDQWVKDGGQFIPNPATWLNQKRWEDEIEVAGGKHNVALPVAPIDIYGGYR